MMKPLQIAPTLMIVAAAMAVGIAAQSPPASAARSVESLEARARRVQREAIVIDTHIDTTGHLQRSGWRFTDRHEPSDGHVDLPRMKEGGVTGAFFAVDGLDQVKGPEILEPALAGLDALRAMAEQMPPGREFNDFVTVESVEVREVAGSVHQLDDVPLQVTPES